MIPLVENETLAKPREALPHSTLAELYVRSGKKEKAIAQIETALALAPEDPGVLESVGAAYARMGDRARAGQSVKNAMQKGESVETIKNDPALRDLLNDPSFRISGK